MQFDGQIFSIVGALESFPRRIAAREIARRGGILRRGLSRHVDHAVFGGGMVRHWSTERIDQMIRQAARHNSRMLSENGFLRGLGLLGEPSGGRELDTPTLVARSNLTRTDFERLALFDAFESFTEPFGFRDLVSAKQYASLIAQGADWREIALAAKVRSSPFASSRFEFTASQGIQLRSRGGLSDLHGQASLPLQLTDVDIDEVFEAAESAEQMEDWKTAERLYRKCLELERGDPVIAFNLSHVYLMLGNSKEAVASLHAALKIDPKYVEAWYNLGTIAMNEKQSDLAKRYFGKAISASPDYPDAFYNLALLEMQSGEHAAADRHWRRYLDLDDHSAWAENARRGLQLLRLLSEGQEPQNVPEMKRGNSWTS